VSLDDRLARYAPPDPPATNGSKRNGAAARQVVLTPASVITPKRVQWLWKDRIPLPSLVVVAGEPGLGKSTFTNAHLAAHVTRGTLEGEMHGHPRDVLIATAEDDWPSVVVPRLMAAGADLERVHRVQVRNGDGTSLLTLPDDAAILESECQRLREAGRPVGLIVVDPVGAFLSESTIGPDDLVSGQDAQDERSELEEAKDWLRYELADGQWHESGPVKAAAEATGIAKRTLERAAKVIGVETTREGFHPATGWRLPSVAPTPLARRDGATDSTAANDAVEPNRDGQRSSSRQPRQLARRDAETLEDAILDPERTEVLRASVDGEIDPAEGGS
jgi:hypothetical protein